MKKLLCITVISLLFLTACEPDDKDIFNLEKIKIKGRINNTSLAIFLGDTIKLDIRIPDTIQSSSGNLIVQSIQYANFYMRILKIDTISNRALQPNPSSIWTSNGSISTTNSYNYLFNLAVKPYQCTINFKPQEKGIYYFEVVTQPGDFKINASFEARLYVNFDVPDKHLHLIPAALGGQSLVNAINEAESEGFGFYVFRVN